MVEKMECPYCKSELVPGVVKCKYCGEFIDGRNDKKEEKTDEQKKKHQTTIGCISIIILGVIIVAIIGSSSDSTPTTPETPIQRQFSAWDGSHINLTRLIKASMKDPSSFDHVSSTYINHGTYLTVTEIYRGKNSFGAIVPESMIANIDMSGNILKILSD